MMAHTVVSQYPLGLVQGFPTDIKNPVKQKHLKQKHDSGRQSIKTIFSFSIISEKVISPAPSSSHFDERGSQRELKTYFDSLTDSLETIVITISVWVKIRQFGWSTALTVTSTDVHGEICKCCHKLIFSPS